MKPTYHQHIVDTEAMLAYGRKLAKSTEHQTVIFLQGQLGTGKTTFVRGFLDGLGYSGPVKSPTYTLVEIYDLPNGRVLHWDLYRLSHTEELELIGLRDYLSQPSWWLIEWPERFIDILPPADLVIDFKMQGTSRELILEPYTEIGLHLV